MGTAEDDRSTSVASRRSGDLLRVEILCRVSGHHLPGTETFATPQYERHRAATVTYAPKASNPAFCVGTTIDISRSGADQSRVKFFVELVRPQSHFRRYTDQRAWGRSYSKIAVPALFS
jgi:hypothetical protein